jgi:hypothetical protein
MRDRKERTLRGSLALLAFLAGRYGGRLPLGPATGLSLLLDGNKKLPGETVEPAGQKKETGQPEQGTFEFLDTEENDPLVLLAERIGVHRMNAETPPLPDNLLPWYASRYSG